MRLVVPPRVPPRVIERVRELAVTVFELVDCSGLARVDFFVGGTPRRRWRVLVNELNTMPGFTSTSVFAALFESSGVGYAELLDRLLALALERYEAQRELASELGRVALIRLG